MEAEEMAKAKAITEGDGGSRSKMRDHCKNKNMDFPYIETAKKC